MLKIVASARKARDVVSLPPRAPPGSRFGARYPNHPPGGRIRRSDDGLRRLDHIGRYLTRGGQVLTAGVAGITHVVSFNQPELLALFSLTGSSRN
jgi:hypothetical protein